jgi:ferritin-like metal-binding protein YciE
MRFNSLHDLFVEQLRDLYDAEDQIVAALRRKWRTRPHPPS